MNVLIVVNALACLVLFAVLGWIILSPSIRDGVLIKAGLFVTALGLLGCAIVVAQHAVPEWRPLLSAMLIVSIGGFLTLCAVVLAVIRDPAARRMAYHATGWPSLGDVEGATHD